MRGRADTTSSEGGGALGQWDFMDLITMPKEAAEKLKEQRAEVLAQAAEVQAKAGLLPALVEKPEPGAAPAAAPVKVNWTTILIVGGIAAAILGGGYLLNKMR